MELQCHLENNIYWYYRKAKSIGFSYTNTINLNFADNTEGSLRLSWHLEDQGDTEYGTF